MKYCYNCNHITPGDPLFCNFCGRSYNVKICVHKHANPRTAVVCSQCGSREFSTPQPRIPWWAPALELVIGIIPGLLLISASVTAVIVVANNPELLSRLVAILLLLALLWWMWLQIPRWFREAIHKFLKRHNSDDRRKP